MLRSTWTSIITAGLLIGFTTGCSTMSNTVVRSQSPENAQLLIQEEKLAQGEQAFAKGEIVQTGGGTWTGESRMKGELRGLAQSNLYGHQVSHHGYHTPRSACPDGSCNNGPGHPGAISPYWRRGNFDAQPCPPGAGNCPPNHQEQSWDHGGRRHRGQYDYHTYSYKRPDCLVNPQPNQPGGTVTYPYYTHKGPSDFFWKGDGAL